MRLWAQIVFEIPDDDAGKRIDGITDQLIRYLIVVFTRLELGPDTVKDGASIHFLNSQMDSGAKELGRSIRERPKKGGRAAVPGRKPQVQVHDLVRKR